MPNENVLTDCYLTQKNSQIYIGVLVTFDSSGKVTDARIAGSSSGCKAFDEEVLRAAKKIKFKPEIKNGAPVTIIKPVTYQVNINVMRNL